MPPGEHSHGLLLLLVFIPAGACSFGGDLLNQVFILSNLANSQICTTMACSKVTQASQVAPVIKNPAGNAGDARDLSAISGLGKAPAGGNGNPLRYSCLENPIGRRAWWAIYSPWGGEESDTTELHIYVHN